MSVYGPTGSGKSHFEKHILTERARLRGSRIVIVCTKPADKTISSTGWPIVHSWPPARGWTQDRRQYRQVIYWATAKGLGRQGRIKQAAQVEDLLEQLWVPESNTIIWFDELAYICKELQLQEVVERYYREGRALGITVGAGTQRPQGVTRYMHSESSWSAFFKPKDDEDAERMAQVGGNKLYYLRVFRELDKAKYEFCLVHELTGESYITSLPRNPHQIKISRPAQESPKSRDHSV